jgi:glycosyltransferase involved in cell wall biosynthesis
MRILHVTPHLGGGVGKAHAALSAVLPEIVQQTFVLLEAPRDRRYIDMIKAAGARVLIADNLAHVAVLARESDIVQFEFWNHPRMFECLARAELPAMRSVFWSHVSGIARPLIQPALMAEATRFVFTTEASLASASVAALRRKTHKKVSAINSGFGFPDAAPRIARGRVPGIAYLGTVDFVKMHPGFFDAIDALDDDSVRVAVWGEVDPQGAVVARAKAMRHPNRVEFMGPTSNPAAALALVEAMSLGLAPLVLDNPAEKAIVQDGQTGFIASSIEEIGSLLEMLLLLPDVREKISRNAIHAMAETRTPAMSAQDFMILWLGMLAEPARVCNFASAIGSTPAEWFLSTQRLAGRAWAPEISDAAARPAKGTLAHFESVFAVDDSFARLKKAHA